ncbi:MAG: hypothetical protein HY815_34195, partial [Candidatus Riflebacteria bacterium]|nr:hypothetical protein [Candidatus Riflebacteria bacterium]
MVETISGLFSALFGSREPEGLPGGTPASSPARGGPGALLRRTGPVQFRHQTPGRVRFSLPALRGQPRLGSELQTQLKRLKDVDEVTVTPISGSLVIRYHGARLDAALLGEVVAGLLKLGVDSRPQELSFIRKELGALTHVLDRALFERTGGILDLRVLLVIM